MTVADVEPDGVVRLFAVNRAAADFYGVGADRLEERSLDDLNMRPEGRAEAVKQRYYECLRAGQAVQYRDFAPVDTRHEGRRWVHVTMSPLTDPSDVVPRVMATIVDVTDLKRSEDELAEALTKILGGFVAICASCKKIREEDKSWQPVEGYISRRSEARFSHTMCPECSKKWYGDFAEE